MTPERWREIERLYHSAREHGPSVLEGTDPELRSEVEKLLEQDSSGKFLDRPAAEYLETAKLPDAAGESAWAGQTVSHYQILQKLGAGGMGVVYRAFDTNLGRYVALKFLPPEMRHNPELKRRLADEARAASALDHPNIVVIHEIGQTADGHLFIAMALHEGVTLRERIAAGLPAGEALQIARQVASGLARAHENGIIHRDIKPSNIIVAKDGIARIIDFGLARTSDATVTTDGAARGTPLYMSPEQASGKPLDYRTDLWSLGAVLFEMLTGSPPFPGDSQLPVMNAIVHDPAPRLRDIRPELPTAVDGIVARALEKDPAKRYQSAAGMGRDLTTVLAVLEAPMHRRPRWQIAVAVLVLALAGAGFLAYQRSEKRHWARETAIPQINELASKEPMRAFLLYQRAHEILPGDPQLEKFVQDFTRADSIKTTPAGAKVEIQDYNSPSGEWLALGTTPIQKAFRPRGYLRWRFSLPGVPPFVIGGIGGIREYSLPPAEEPPGMVLVPAGPYGDMIGFIGMMYENLPAFDIDKFEVTNAQYQQFVDAGGYRKPEYWKEKFIRDGKEITWEQAMDLFRDPTGRAGPSTWEGGHFPANKADYPVSGVSWYEAAAYAQFAGKSLPALLQWFKAAPADYAPYTIMQSNFDPARGPARVGSLPGVGAYGTYDMAGNVREWCLNPVDRGQRFILGGAWKTQTYQAYYPEALPPLDRSELNGIRCVRNRAPLSERVTGPITRMSRDFSTARPVTDDVFQAYRLMHAYDQVPPNPQNEKTVEETADWTKEQLSIDAGTGGERLPVFLFLPKKVSPPFQAVVFFPSARVNGLRSTDRLGDMAFIDYVIKSGRALIYPIYTGTYGRGPRHLPGAYNSLGRIVKCSREVRRSVDYLATRPDIDASKLAYLGVSQGTAEGVIYTALESRFKALVFLDGGFFFCGCVAVEDQVNFVTRIKAPVLMVNGKYDFTFPPDQSQEPMFRMLGTPDADKRHVMFDTPHDVSQQKAALSKEVLAWLDKYLGRVN